MAGHTYEGAVRPFFRMWILGVFVSGGAVLAFAYLVKSYLAWIPFLRAADEFGQGLVYVSVLVFLVEASVYGFVRRLAAARLSRLEARITRIT